MIHVLMLVVLVACLLTGLFLARSIRLTEFTSHRGRASFRHVLFTNVATLVGGWMFFGLNAIGHLAGVLGYVIGVAYAVGLILLGLLAPRIKEAMVVDHCDNLDDFIGARYGVVAQSLSTVLNSTFFIAILAAQFLAMAAFLTVFIGAESVQLLYVVAAIVITYTTLAGFKGVLITDVWQFVILSLAAIAFFTVLVTTTDWSGFQGLDRKFFTGTGFGQGFLIAIVAIFPVSILVRTDLWQRISSATDAPTAKRAFILSAFLLIVFYFLLTSCGMFGRVGLGADVRPDTSAFMLFLEASQATFPTVVSKLLVAVLSAGVFVALLSTADTNLNVIAVSVSKLMCRPTWQHYEASSGAAQDKQAEMERYLLRHVRLATVILGIIAVGIATAIPDIVNLIVGAAAAVMIFIPSVLVTLLSGARKKAAAIASMTAGMVTLVPFMVLAPKLAMIPAFVAAVVGYFAVAPFVKSEA